MKALSIRNPWAWLVKHGHKDIENRTWRTAYRGPLLIHASLKPAQAAQEIREWARSEMGILIPKQLEAGGIVGVVDVVDVVEQSTSPWFEGPFGFVLMNAKPCPFIPLRGRLGLFDVESTICPIDPWAA